MRRVLHYDYSGYTTPEAMKLGRILQMHPDIAYFRFEMPKTAEERRFTENRQRVERILKEESIDVLLIHPGADGQRIVLDEFPQQYPELRVALLGPLTNGKRYEGRVRMLATYDVTEIVQFALSRKK